MAKGTTVIIILRLLYCSRLQVVINTFPYLLGFLGTCALSDTTSPGTKSSDETSPHCPRRSTYLNSLLGKSEVMNDDVHGNYNYAISSSVLQFQLSGKCAYIATGGLLMFLSMSKLACLCLHSMPSKNISSTRVHTL